MKGLAEQRAKKFAEGSDASMMYEVVLAGGSRGDNVTVGQNPDYKRVKMTKETVMRERNSF